MPQRIQRKRTRGWRIPNNAIYVGRPTVFGNPFLVRRATGQERARGNWTVCDDNDVIYETWLESRQAQNHAVSLFYSDLLNWQRIEDQNGLPDLSCTPDDYETIDAYAYAMATLAADSGDDETFAVGGSELHGYIETEYAIEPLAGDYARGIDTELAGPIEELPTYRAGARVITREVTYGPWRYVTSVEIEAEGASWDA
jgi:hypothetical protein